MKIIAHDGAGAKLTSEMPNENLWIEVEREDGEWVYVGSLYFDKASNGSIVVQFGSARNDHESWEPTEEVLIPAHELTVPPSEGVKA